MVDYDRSHGFLSQSAFTNNRIKSSGSTSAGTNASASYMAHHRTSPHLSHLEHHPTSSPIPSPHFPPHAQLVMSSHPPPLQNVMQSRQPTSYPSPHSYPSPSMSAYAYPPPPQPPSAQQHSQQQQAGPGLGPAPLSSAVDSYRASPTGSHVSLPSLNLPPIRHINDPRASQSGPPPMGSALPPPGAPMTGYYAQSLSVPQHAMNVTSSPHPHPHAFRYPLPQPDGRIMSGGRHKKEIKRRTKTGCLTCRKRRIKCDEAHPTCRNCQKSKRECLGYDPIFKSQPGPPAIQPAPSSAHPGSTSSSAPYPPPPGYVPAVAGQYPPALSATGSSPASSVEPYDYSSAIDPALETAGPSNMSVPTHGYEGGPGYRSHVKRELGSGSPYSSASDPHGARAKRIKIDDLLAVGGTVPPPLTPQSENSVGAPNSLSPAALDEIKRFYSDHYAPAMDDFLEVKWYATRGLPWLLSDPRFCEQMYALMERIQTVYHEHDVQAFGLTQSHETRMIWQLLCLARVAGAANKAASMGSVEQRDASTSSPNEAIRRLSIFEDLVSGAVSETNLADLARLGSVQHDPIKLRELEFWRLIGKFLTLRDDEASSAKEIDDALAGCRSLLDSRENRDVIYSIAIARHLGQRLAEYSAVAPEAVNPDEHEARQKLSVAKDFIEHEAAGRGTTLIIQRLCAMAVRAWQANTSSKETAAIGGSVVTAGPTTDPALRG